MPVLTRDQAIELLTNEVEKDLPADDILQIHNELFPDTAVSEETVHADSNPSRKHILSYLNSDLAVEDLLDLWNLICPKHRRVRYDNLSDKFHYNENFYFSPAE